jgi:citrate lyase subunit beta/citryl-CoA lyase
VRVIVSALPTLRTVLFVPASRPELVPKALAAGADALVLDLEDSVPAQGKNLARIHAAAALAELAARFTFVRFNHPGRGELEQDLSVLAPHDAQAVMLPKVENPKDLEAIDARLSLFEKEASLSQYAISILVVIETSSGLRALYDILRSTPRVRGAGLATAEQGDFMLDIGGQWTPAGEALTYARGKFVCDARAAQAAWILDGAFMNLRDQPGLAAEARIARTHGFSGKVAVHPRQVATINEVFSPTDAEIERASKLLEAFGKAEALGQGAVEFRGMMVDYANVRWAERILQQARATQRERQ